MFVGEDAYMIQTPLVTATPKRYNNVGSGGKEKLRFLQLIWGLKSDGMHGVSSDALGLEYFQGRA